MLNSHSDLVFRRLSTCVVVVLCTSLLSCARPEGIRTYTVETVGAGQTLPAPTPGTGVSAAAWFFKLQGSPAAVSAQAALFEDLLKSVTFNTREEPEWELPAGWTNGPGGRMRFATVKIGGSDPPLEIAVSMLTRPDPTEDAFLRMNVERWRDQVRLPPYSGTDWREQALEMGDLQTMTVAGGPAFLVKLTGKDRETGAPASILAVMIPRAGVILPEPIGPPSAGGEMDLPITYTAPPEWQSTPPGPVQLLRFTVADGAQQVEISMTPAGGDLEMNIARWRGQVKLPEASPDELRAALQPIEIDGVPGHYAEITGDTETILGAVVPHGGTNLFFKLRGDNGLAARERERFREFLSSLHFKP